MAQPLKMIHGETDLHRAITTPAQLSLSAARELRADLLCCHCHYQDARYDVFNPTDRSE